MRVTQSMLSNNMLRNLNVNYGKMAKLQEQLNTGSKIGRPSDDPVIAVKGMSYRVDLDKVEQFKRNMNEANTWLDTTDEALGQAGDQLIRVKELLVQAASDTNSAEDREMIKIEINQIREHIKNLANTQIGDKYIFSGTHTSKPLYVDGAVNPDLGTGVNKAVEIEIYDGISMRVNTDAAGIFDNIDTVLGKISEALTAGSATNNSSDLSALLGDIANNANSTLATAQNEILAARADVGAKQNRSELMMNRLDLQALNITKQLSENEDVDYSAAITEMATAESIHQASLSVGAKIIQQTLVDFIR